MANLLTKRQQGSLPSNSEVNPRREGKEHVKAITLQSGRELVAMGQPLMVREMEIEEVDQASQKDQMQGEQPQEKKSVEESEKTKKIEKQADTDEPVAQIS